MRIATRKQEVDVKFVMYEVGDRFAVIKSNPCHMRTGKYVVLGSNETHVKAIHVNSGKIYPTVNRHWLDSEEFIRLLSTLTPVG